jgi:hypothetical protein
MLKMIASLFAPKKIQTVAPMQNLTVDCSTHGLLRSLGSLVPFTWTSTLNGDGSYTLTVKDAEEARIYLARFEKKEEPRVNTRTYWKVTVTTTRWDRYTGKDVTTLPYEREWHESHLAHIDAGKIRQGNYRNYWFHTRPRYQGDPNIWVGKHHNDSVRIEITQIEKPY